MDTILALKDNWSVGATMPDFYQLSSDHRFRLVFGQSNARTETASGMVFWITALDVQLSGRPPETPVESPPVIGPGGEETHTGADSQTPGSGEGSQNQVPVESGEAGITGGEAQQLHPAVEAETDDQPVQQTPQPENGTGEPQSQPAGGTSWHIYEMEETALLPEQKTGFPLIWLWILVLILAGGTGRCLEYRREKRKSWDW